MTEREDVVADLREVAAEHGEPLSAREYRRESGLGGRPLMDLDWCYRDACEAAGVERPGRGPNGPQFPELYDREWMLRKYANKGAEGIAKELGCAQNTASAMASRLGVPSELRDQSEDAPEQGGEAAAPEPTPGEELREPDVVACVASVLDSAGVDYTLEEDKWTRHWRADVAVGGTAVEAKGHSSTNVQVRLALGQCLGHLGSGAEAAYAAAPADALDGKHVRAAQHAGIGLIAVSADAAEVVARGGDDELEAAVARADAPDADFDAEDAAENRPTPTELADKIADDGLADVIGVHGNTGFRRVDADLIQVKYDVSGPRATKAKKLLTRRVYDGELDALS